MPVPQYTTCEFKKRMGNQSHIFHYFKSEMKYYMYIYIYIYIYTHTLHLYDYEASKAELIYVPYKETGQIVSFLIS